MEHLPLFIPVTFALTTLLTVILLYKAGNDNKLMMIMLTGWLALQAAISLSGFYLISTGFPPRFALLLMPPLIGIAVLFISRKGRSFINGLNTGSLTLIHIVRIPVELTLYWLFIHKAVPGLMTFEGRNFDILCGITAPVVYYLGYYKHRLNKAILLAWNLVCLVLLLNIVITAVLSAPFSFQKLAFDQPNIALFYFPFVWLPSLVVPAALFAHLATIRKLFSKTDNQ